MNQDQVNKISIHLSNLIDELGSDVKDMELEMRSSMNAHAAIRLIREFSTSSQVITTRYGPSPKPATKPSSISKHINVVDYFLVGGDNELEVGTDRARSVVELSNPYDLIPDVAEYENAEVSMIDHKIRVTDILFNSADRDSFGIRDIKSLKISLSLELEPNDEVSIDDFEEVDRRVVIRYDIGDELRSFLGLRCKNSKITIDKNIRSESKSGYDWISDLYNPYRMEMEFANDSDAEGYGETDTIDEFVNDIRIVHEYIISYQAMTRPEDLSRDEITFSTFFGRGDYRATVKNNGTRHFIFFQKDKFIMMDGGTEEIKNTRVRTNNYPQLEGITIDFEAMKLKNDMELSVSESKAGADGRTTYTNIVLDAWHRSMNSTTRRPLNHEERIKWLMRYEQELTAFKFIFKEFHNLTPDNYHSTIESVWNQVQDKDEEYDGIILVPQHRPFYSPFHSSTVPKIYRFKTYQTIDMNNSSFKSLRHRYKFEVDQRPKDNGIVEYKIVSAIRNFRTVIINLQKVRVRRDRKNPNRPHIIHKIIDQVLDGVKIEDLLGTQLNRVTIPFYKFGLFEVIEDLGIPIVGGNHRDANVVLFPDQYYPWPSGVDRLGRDYVDLIVVSRIRDGVIEVINDIPSPLEFKYLFPDSLAVNRQQLNSFVVLKVRFKMASDIQTYNTIFYNIHDNFLVKILSNAYDSASDSQELPEFKAIYGSFSTVVNENQIPIHGDSYLDPSLGPVWWAPSHGYPALTTLYNFLILGILMKRDKEPLFARIVEYLSPIGMVRFLTLTSGAMEAFLDEVETELGIKAVCRFLVPFLVIFRIQLGIDIFAEYKGVSISSTILADDINLDGKSRYTEGDAYKNRLQNLSDVIEEPKGLASVPGVYFFKNDIRSSVMNRFVEVVNKNAGILNVLKLYDMENFLMISADLERPKSEEESKKKEKPEEKLDNYTLDIISDLSAIVDIACKVTRNEMSDVVDDRRAKKNIGSYIPEIFYERLIMERPYLSINWTNDNPNANCPLKTFDVVNAHFDEVIKEAKREIIKESIKKPTKRTTKKPARVTSKGKK